MMHSNQTRMYTISACIERSNSKAQENADAGIPPPALFGPPNKGGAGNSDEITSPAATATSFTLTSWYHATGCDHRIRYFQGDASAWHEISMQATILQGNLGVRKAIRFHNRDTRNNTDSRFVHASIMQKAIEGFCAPTSNESCINSYFEDTLITHMESRVRNVTFWAISDEGSDTEVISSVVGTVTKFDLPLIVYPFGAVEYVLPVLATSIAIEEVEGSGLYTNLDTGEYEEEVADLAYEKGRVASATMILIIFAALLILLLAMRSLLRPVSLADVAHNIIHDGSLRVIIVDQNGTQINDPNNHHHHHHQLASASRTGSVKRRVELRNAEDNSSSVKASLDSGGSSSFSRSP